MESFQLSINERFFLFFFFLSLLIFYITLYRFECSQFIEICNVQSLKELDIFYLQIPQSYGFKKKKKKRIKLYQKIIFS